MNKIKRHIYELKSLAFTFTFCAGFIDAYTFIERGGTLAVSQTGNIVFFGMDLAHYNMPGSVAKVLTFLAYILGLIVVAIVPYKFRSKYKRAYCILPITFITLIVGFIPANVPNACIVPFLAFGIAMQTIAFRKIEKLGYINVISIGNIRNLITSWIESALNKEEGQVHQKKVHLRNYLLLVSGFACGAMISSFLDNFFKIHTIWIATIILVIINICYWLMIYHEDTFYNDKFSL